MWCPINFLLIEALQKLHHFYGDSFTVELPRGSGRRASLWQAAAEVFAAAYAGFSALGGWTAAGLWRGLRNFRAIRIGAILFCFHEYFHGDNGAGIGASCHQTGWTGVVAKLIEQSVGRGCRWANENFLGGARASSLRPEL